MCFPVGPGSFVADGAIPGTTYTVVEVVGLCILLNSPKRYIILEILLTYLIRSVYQCESL